MTPKGRLKRVKLRHFQSHQNFQIINAIFDSYCIFCLFGSYIAHFFVLFHWFIDFWIGYFMKHQLIKLLGNQSFDKILLFEFISKLLIFVQFSDVTEPHSQVKMHVTYIDSGRTFYWLSYPFYKTQKNCFCFWEMDLSAIP